MENNQNTNSSSKFSIAKILFFRWKLMLILAIIGIIIGSSLSVVRNVVTYKASKSVMLITKMASSDVDIDNAITGDIINDVLEQIKSDKYVSYVNENYPDGAKVNKNAISTSRSNDDTFIFTITYSAKSSKEAEECLDKIIKFSNVKVFEKEIPGQETTYENFFEYHTVADTITVKAVQYDVRIKQTSTLARNLVVSIILSLVVAVGVGVIVDLMDNAISDKGELEEITGVNLLSLIEDSDLPSKSKKKNKKK